MGEPKPGVWDRPQPPHPACTEVRACPGVWLFVPKLAHSAHLSTAPRARLPGKADRMWGRAYPPTLGGSYVEGSQVWGQNSHLSTGTH